MNWNNILDYHDGNLVWKSGEITGTAHSLGYIQIAFEGNLYMAHRIVWEISIRKHMHELTVIEAKLKLILRQIEKQPTTSYGQAYVQLRQLLSLVRKMNQTK